MKKIMNIAIVCSALFGSMPLYAAQATVSETKAETTETTKTAEDKTTTVKSDSEKAEKAAQKTVKQRKAGDFIPTESISEDLAVSFPIDI